MKKYFIILCLVFAGNTFAETSEVCIEKISEVRCSNAVIVLGIITAHCYQEISLKNSDNSSSVLKLHGTGEALRQDGGDQAAALFLAKQSLQKKLSEIRLPVCI